MAASLAARIAAAWAWLGRPPVAAGFASVMVAGVVGLMWWDRPIEEALPHRDAAVPLAATAPAPSSAPAPAADTPVGAAPPAIAPPAATAPAAPATRPAPAAAARQQVERRVAAVPPAATVAAPAPPTAAQATGAAAAGRPADARLADATPRAAPAEPAGAAAESAARGMAAERADRAERVEREDRSRAAATLAKAAPPAAAPTPSSRRAFAAAGDAPSPLAAMRAAIVDQPGRWRWQRGSAGLRALDADIARWLARADAATAARWSDSAADSESDAATLEFWLDERLHTTLRLDATGVAVDTGGAPRRRAALAPADAATLRDALDAATR